MNIRRAKLEDALSMLPLINQLGYAHTLESLQGRLTAYLGKEEGGIFIAEDQGTIVGLLAYVIYEMFTRESKSCHVKAIVIDQPYRGQGMGTQLMKFLEAHAHRQGCTMIDLTYSLRRAQERTHDFYRKLGYSNDTSQDAKIYLRKEL